MPYRHSAPFRRVKEGEIIDKNKSVSWNRKEAERLNAEHSKEAERLLRTRYESTRAAEKRAVRMIAKETGLPVAKAETLWNFVCDMYREHGEMFWQIEEYIDLVNQLTK